VLSLTSELRTVNKATCRLQIALVACNFVCIFCLCVITKWGASLRPCHGSGSQAEALVMSRISPCGICGGLCHFSWFSSMTAWYIVKLKAIHGRLWYLVREI